MSSWHDDFPDDDGIAEAEDLLLQAQIQQQNNPKAMGRVDTKKAPEPSFATSVRKKKTATLTLTSGGKTATRGKSSSSTEDASRNRGKDPHAGRLSYAPPSSQTSSTEWTEPPLSKNTSSANDTAITEGSSTYAMPLTGGATSEPYDYILEEEHRDSGGRQNTSQVANASSGLVQSLRRSQNESTPGAHMVLGPGDYFDSDDDDAIEDDTGADVEQFRDEEIMIEASLVKDIDDNDLTGVLVLPAKRDPWWRRNQMWIGAGILVVIVAIILSVTLTSIDLSPPDAPTMSPTTEFTGLEDDTKSIIMDIFPSTMAAIGDEGSIQARAFEWVLEQRNAGRTEDGAAANLTVRQQYTLVALYLSTGGPSSWTVKDSWMNTTTDECFWHGVVCKDQVITEIVLPQNGLVGTIPPEIAMLAEQLTSIIFSNNALTGSIPSEIGNLLLLSSLSLNDNLMSGPIPSSINSLISLKFLDLSSNRLASSIPDSLSGLSALQFMDVSKNRLVDVVPSEVGSLGMLEELYFGENKISFTLPSEIGILENLRILSGEKNIIRGSLPTDIGLLRNLMVFDFGGNRLSGTVPGEFTSLRNLTILNVGDNLLQGSLPKSIGLLTKLEMLAVANNLFNGDFPGTLRLIDTLTHLNISDNSWWHGSVGNIIGHLTGLQTLAAARCGITWGQSNTEILEAQDLEVLDLSGNQWIISQSDFTQIFSSLSKLRELKLARLLSGTLYIPSSVGLLSHLEILDIEGSVSMVGVSTQLISSGGIVGTLPTELGRLANLTALNLGRNQMTGQISILSEFLNVESIQLQGNRFSGPLPYLGNSTQLKIFDIHKNLDVTGTFPAEVFELSNLEILKLGDTATSGSLPSQWGSLSQLQTLDLHNTLISGDVMGLTGLDSLEDVDLSNTLLTGNVTASVLAMYSLTRLSLAQSPGLFGTLTPAIGQLSKLVTMNVAQVNFTMSSLPSEIGRLSSLVTLNMQETGIQGTVPSELFQCYQLQVISLSGNNQIDGSLDTAITQLIILSELDFSGTSINGTLPEEFGSLILLESLDLSASKVATPFPSSFGRLDKLKELSFRGAKEIVKLPTEIGILTSLTRLDVSESGIKNGTLPSLERFSNLEYLNLQGTDISGTISEDSILCKLISLEGTPGGRHRSLQLYFSPRALYVDCNKVICECCLCSTDLPSEVPSRAPSESQRPSSTTTPSQQPSGSMMPSQSEEPSSSAIDCDEFVSFSQIGTALPFTLQADEEIVVVDLPIGFDWFDQTISSVGVVANGALMINPFDVDTFGFLILPNEIANGFKTEGGRIAVAHADLLLREDGRIYVAELENSVGISWENMTVFGFEPPLTINFQTVLHSDGTVEMRWGPGSLDGTGVQFVAGLQDIALDIMIPAGGDNFTELGVSEISIWPAMSCRMLSASTDNFTPSPSMAAALPSVSPWPTVTDSPTTVWENCNEFVSLARVGTALPFLPKADEEIVVVDLPIGFDWFDQTILSVGVHTNGALMINPSDVDVFGISILPIEKVNVFMTVGARVAVAHADLLLREDGQIYVAELENAVGISWENMTVFGFEPPLTINFQTVLHSDGNIEIRWGPGSLDNTGAQFVAGLQDIALGIAVPAEGDSFNSLGVSKMSNWPAMTCRMLSARSNGLASSPALATSPLMATNSPIVSLDSP